MKEIAPNVFVETDYALVTVGAILTDAGWVCVDSPPYPRDAHHWLTSLRNISDRPIRYLINTDHHRDRILGNSWFNAPVVAHEAAAEQMLALGSGFITQAAEELSANDNEMVQIASLKLVPPQISYTHLLTLHCGRHQIEVVSKPSATRGSTWVVLKEEKVFFTGDTLVTTQHPNITEGTSKMWLDALRLLRLKRYADWIVVPGREDITDNAASEALSFYLRLARRRVKSLCQSSCPRSEIAGLVPEFLELFPYSESAREQVLRRIRTGLEVIYEEISSKGSQMDEEE